MKAALERERQLRTLAEAKCKEQSGTLRQLEAQYTVLVSGGAYTMPTPLLTNGGGDANGQLQAAREHLGVAMQAAETEQALRLEAEAATAQQEQVRNVIIDCLGMTLLTDLT